MAYILIPKTAYSQRPAFRLLLSAIIGVLIFNSGHLFVVSVVLLIIALILFFNPYDKSLSEVFVWIILFAIAFAFYCDLRSRDYKEVKTGVTIYDTQIKILNPVITSAENRIRYRAKVKWHNKWIDIQLDVPTPQTIDIEDSYGSVGIATLDISPLSSIQSESYKKYLISNGINATGSIQTISELRPMEKAPLTSRLLHWRYHLKERFEQISSEHISWQNRGLIYALSLGDRSLLPTEIKRQFSDSGVAHILALSGYHLGVVMWLVSIVLARVIWRHKWRHIRYLVMIILLIAYTLFSGASVATVRALLMSSIALTGKFVNRDADPVQLLSLVAVIFLVINPFSYLSVGLLLSISAVWGIYSFFNLFCRLLNPTYKILQWFRDVICITISAQIGVFPLLLIYFGSAPLTFIWSNIPLVFISGILIPLSLISFVLMLIFGGLPIPLLEALNFLSDCMNAVTNMFSNHQWNLELHFDWISLILYYIIAYTSYRLLYSYTCRVELKRLINKGTELYD